MEDLLLSWPLEAPTLEPLQPLSFSELDGEESSINLDKLSRSEIAGKLLDHLDQIAEGQETDPFDWFATNEKSIDLPIFENISSPIPVGLQNSSGSFKPSQPTHYPYFDSPEYEPTFAQTNDAFGGSAIPGAAQPHLTYAPSFGAVIAMDAASPPHGPCTTPASPPDVKKEVLTPPDSPKDEEILKFLKDMKPGDWDLIVPEPEPRVPDISTTISEDSCPADDLSDYPSTGSPYLASESNSDNDADYVPTRRISSGRVVGGNARRRTSKPYSRQTVEEKKLRKKEQNKNAATRYRIKKKQEVEESKFEEQRLADYNRELRSKLDDISREVKCLKSLMRDVYRKKGLIK